MTSSFSGSTTSSGTTLTTTMTGTGAITAHPFRMHIILHTKEGGLAGVKPMVVTTEEITDGTDVYIKLPQLPGQKTKKPWMKIAFGSLGGATGSISSGDVLDFSQLQHAIYVGEETINGYQTWHLRAPLANLLSGTNPATATEVAGLMHGITIHFVEDLWIREDTHFPVEIVINESSSFNSTSLGQTPTSGIAGSFSMNMVETMVFTTWNTGITIALPPASQVATSTIPTTISGAFGQWMRCKASR